MTIRHSSFVLACCLVFTVTGQASASLCGLAGRVLHRHLPGGRGSHLAGCDYQCHTVMKTMTRTVYETVNETQYKTVYDTTYENRVIQGVERIPIVSYQERPYTYHRPQVDVLTKEVPYTFTWPVYETMSKDVHYVTYVPTYETKTRHVPYTTYHPVTETHSRTVHYTVPRRIHYTQTIPIHGGRWETCIEKHPGPIREKCIQERGCWKWDPCCCRCVYVPGACKRIQIQCPPIKVRRRVWVPTVEHRTIPCSKVVYETRSRQVPYTATRMVPQTHTRPITYTVTRMMPVTQTRTVQYQVARMMSEQRARTVSYPVTRMIPETATQTVPVTTYREVPTSSTICVPRSIPRSVAYNVTRCVPRTETYQVPVRVCVPVPRCTCDPGCGCDTGPCDTGSATLGDDDLQVPLAPQDEAPSLETSPSDSGADSPPVRQAGLTVTSLDETGDELPGATLLFTAGLEHLRGGEWSASIEQFEAAAKASPASAKYVYFLALAQRRAGLGEAAEATLAEAVARERVEPIDHWGRTMQRVQGNDRLWLEAARGDAGL